MVDEPLLQNFSAIFEVGLVDDSLDFDRLVSIDPEGELVEFIFVAIVDVDVLFCPKSGNNCDVLAWSAFG
jgi:hypothetical protein